MNLRKKIIVIQFAILFLIMSNMAYANGIPVVFAVTAFHVLIINIFVIAIETYLLKRLSQDKVFFGYVLVANLASIFLAYILTNNTVSAYFHTPWFGLEQKGEIKKRLFITGVVFFILFTILIEWPFFHLAQKHNRSWLQTLKYSAIINLITNVPIALFYLVNDLYYSTDD